MSRIVKNILDGVISSDHNELILFHSNKQSDLTYTKSLTDKIYILEEFQLKHNFILLQEHQINLDLSIRPRCILNTNIMQFQNALNLANTLRLKLINILDDLPPIKKEGAFNMSASIDSTTNLILKEDIISKLFLSNYELVKSIDDIPNLIYEVINDR